MVAPIHDVFQPEVAAGLFAGGLPKKLAVGESHSSFFPHNAQSFGRENLKSVGFLDNFDRTHWAKRSDIRKVKTALDKTFADTPYQAMEVPEESD